MKTIFLFLVTCSLASAIVSKRVTFDTDHPLPTTYSASNTSSLIISEMGVGRKDLFMWTNVAHVGCNIAHDSYTVAPTTPSGGLPEGEEVFVIISEPTIWKDVYPSKNIYCRSLSGAAITNGNLFFTVW